MMAGRSAVEFVNEIAAIDFRATSTCAMDVEEVSRFSPATGF